MKIYIETLTKKERAGIKERFLAAGVTPIYHKAKRLNIISIIGVFLMLLVTIGDIFLQTGWINYLLDGFLLVFCLFYIFKTKDLILNELNNFALKEQKASKDQKKKPKKKTN